MAADNAESKFRRDALAIISSHSDAVNMRLDRTENAVAELTKVVQLQAQNIGGLGEQVSALTSATERLERGIAAMVDEGRSQRQTVDNLIKLCTA